MIDAKTLSTYAMAIAADATMAAQRAIAGEAEPTEQETLAILQLTLMAAAVLEAHAIHALPPEFAKHVRAFVERLTSDVQRVRNAATETPIIQLPTTPTTPAQPEKETPHGGSIEPALP